MRRFIPLLLLAAGGCQPNPGSYLKVVPPTAAPAGWQTHFKPKAGFSIAFPNSFKVTNSETFGNRNTPILGDFEFLDVSAKPKSGVERLTVGTVEGNNFGFATLVQEDHKHNIGRGRKAQDLEDRLTRGGFKVVDRSEMELPVGKASRIVTERKIGKLSMRWTGYVLVDGHYSYVMLFHGFSLDGSKMPTKQIMRTFRVTKNSPRT